MTTRAIGPRAVSTTAVTSLLLIFYASSRSVAWSVVDAFAIPKLALVRYHSSTPRVTTEFCPIHNRRCRVSLPVISEENSLGATDASSPSSDFSNFANPDGVYQGPQQQQQQQQQKQLLPECAALLPGHTIRIQVGPDLTSSRKAWKKRRRSGSPILLPCSILTMDRESMVRNNVMHILHKYGQTLDDETLGGGKGGGRGVSLPVGQMVKLYERDLGGSLLSHANSLNHPTIGSLLLHLFNDPNISPTEQTGVEVVTGLRNHLLLISTLTKRQARNLVSRAGLVQFMTPDDDEEIVASPAGEITGGDGVAESKESDDEKKNSAVPLTATAGAGTAPPPRAADARMEHIGMVKIRNPTPPPSTTTDTGPSSNKRQRRPPPTFHTEPLSAALRITQRDSESNRIVPNSYHDAFVFSYDVTGDGGSPLLTVTIDPPRLNDLKQRKMYFNTRQQLQYRAEKLRTMNVGKDGGVVMGDYFPRKKLSDLTVGDGPMKCTVVRVSGKAGAAFVDCNVGRERGRKHGGDTVRVLGMLRLDDWAKGVLKGQQEEEERDEEEEEEEVSEEEASIIEQALLEEEDDDDNVMTVEQLFADDDDDDEETMEEMDVTDSFRLSEDGTLTALDPETGSTSHLANLNDEDDEEDYDDDDEEDDDMFAGMSPEERLEAIDMLVDGTLLGAETTTTTEEPPSNEENNLPFLKPGDNIDVYIKAVFPQSCRFMVTTDPTSVQGKKWKDMKREREAAKRKSKLLGMFGGTEYGLQRILELTGTECDGIVKAKSKTGNWFYVQPDELVDEEGEEEGKEFRLPVGVGTPETEDIIQEGDRVRIRLEGIDEIRGQLDLRVLGKLS